MDYVINGVIFGAMGHGKTTLCDAISSCLRNLETKIEKIEKPYVADGTIIVVSATDNPVEHINRYMRSAIQIKTPHILVFLNKIDIVNDSELIMGLAESEIEEFTGQGRFEKNVKIISGSALKAKECGCNKINCSYCGPIIELMEAFDKRIKNSKSEFTFLVDFMEPIKMKHWMISTEQEVQQLEIFNERRDYMPDDSSVRVGSLIKSMREDLNLTQDELGELVGKDKFFICRVERSDSSIDNRVRGVITKLVDLTKSSKDSDLGKQKKTTTELMLRVGIIPEGLDLLLENTCILDIVNELGDPNLEIEEKMNLVEDFNASLLFLLRLLRREKGSILLGK